MYGLFANSIDEAQRNFAQLYNRGRNAVAHNYDAVMQNYADFRRNPAVLPSQAYLDCLKSTAPRDSLLTATAGALIPLLGLKVVPKPRVGPGGYGPSGPNTTPGSTLSRRVLPQKIAGPQLRSATRWADPNGKASGTVAGNVGRIISSPKAIGPAVVGVEANAVQRFAQAAKACAAAYPPR